jgi:hypothetical protein
MGMPRGAGARLERDVRATNTRRCGCLEQRVDANRAGEIVGGSFAGRLRAASLDLYCTSPPCFISGSRESSQALRSLGNYRRSFL